MNSRQRRKWRREWERYFDSSEFMMRMLFARIARTTLRYRNAIHNGSNP